ncbi:hypothetical protein G0U57_005389 [Chelydra serpentina]|uniref:Uncharacterized protein n=1 Tax=Chelydra serpentina TaxID=8475 RepID=A0A8T1SKB0_CHESE|nr:hypothetical protein G0U57_005389 [Chelydra serpentina]
MLLNARRKTRKGGQLEPTYVGSYKIAAVEAKRLKLANKSGKGLARLYSISQLKVFKEPPKSGEENISQSNMKKETAVDDTVKISEVGEMRGNVSHKPYNNQVEVTRTEEEGCVVSQVSSTHPGDFDDMVTEDDEDREWFLKGIASHTVVFKEFIDTLPFIKHVNSFHVGMECLVAKIISLSLLSTTPHKRGGRRTNFYLTPGDRSRGLKRSAAEIRIVAGLFTLQLTGHGQGKVERTNWKHTR